VYGIVKQSGGHISVESERGAGTTFSIWLPQAEAVSAEAGAREAAIVPHTARAASILVAEDEKAVRALIERMLRKHGYRVTAVPDGRAAIEHLERHAHEIDLVIADMVMPHAGGADVAEAAARIAPAMPVILMSGYSEEEILEHARGINPRITFVGKPYSASQMLRTIDWALEGSDAKRA
jgi:CheY-like chemotaxis protein